MNTFIAYIAGACTALIVQYIPEALYIYRDWKWHRRYRKMWDRASAEFDMMDAASLCACQEKWAQQPWRYERWCDDRARYFDMRWNAGQTTEV